ncbi:DUF2057 family protein [Echinimonas agarilytica]|uniref:DUF2057 domain-containing protein n=1 Tax=Echinimonas agarilytica TaxID=1215918 RepID=A0AA41W7J2_9GAMM|nr:DUF2057 family protein [Echinimonas agarilytica]MCM2679818.1 DUF2057 domain-containing protein [Echinimonas agarilytica]
MKLKHAKRTLFNLVGIFLIASTATNVWANQLNTPEHIEVLTINNEKQSWYLFQDSRAIELPLGVVKLEVRYKDLIEDDNDDTHQTITSSKITMTFETRPNEVYQLKAKRPETEKEARQFAKKPVITIHSSAGVVEELNPVYIPTANVVVETPKSEPPTNDVSAKMLRYWWSQADETTKAEFIREISETKSR